MKHQFPFMKKLKNINPQMLLVIISLTMLLPGIVFAEQPPAPCHANPNAAQDRATVANRGDVRKLPQPLKDRLTQLADRPHSFLPIQAFAEADGPSQLFQYYLLDTTGFEPNVFTALFPGVNDAVQLTATGGNCGLPTVGSVRVVLEPKPGLPTDPNNPRAFVDVFTDISPLFVINNESGWYEGWMIHDLTVPAVNPTPRSDGHAQFGTILPADAARLRAMGSGNNTPGNIFTVDGRLVHFPSPFDHFPDVQTNVVPIQESMGAYNAMQQSDVHSYWEFNYQGTNWIHPLYELPFTGGLADSTGEIPDAFIDGEIGKLLSIVPGSGPDGVRNDPVRVGDDPNLPRDPDKFDGTVDAQREFRERGVPSGLANEIYLDVYERLASFEPHVKNLQRRLFDAYAIEVARVDSNGDGIISAVEGDIDTPSDGFPNNERLYLPPTAFNRFAVTREINDGILAPRFAPSQRAWVLSGFRVGVTPAAPASTGRDADDR
ncbi:MAG TPA: hypothetical protein VK738_01195 [Terriglobales bacterium]|jgi:hypothetical protein|nr:hypothetical protein [Terriglobales bacterium]